MNDLQDLANVLPYLTPAERALISLKTDYSPKERMLDFACHVNPTYRPELFHADVAVHLEAIIRRDINRLIIAAPPQFGKSSIASELFPAFHLAKYPDLPLAIASYSADLARIKGRKVREYVESEEFQQLFPDIKTPDDNRAVEMWGIAGHSGFTKAVGRGGGLTGNGIFGGIIDDILKGAEEADSPLILEQSWNWFESDFMTRIWPKGFVIIIGTRWVEDDLTGRILNSKEGKDYTVLRYAALAETQDERDRNNSRYGLPEGLPDPLERQPGESLCPKLRPQDFLENIKATRSTRVWTALYQGSPSAAEGNRIKRAWLENNRVDFLPIGQHIRWVRYWDKAGSDKKSADYTVGCLMAYDDLSHTYYIVDVVRGQWTIGARDEVMKLTSARDVEFIASHGGGKYDIWHEQEPGSAGKDVALLIDKMLSEYSVHHETATGSKEIRAEPFATSCENGYIKLVRQIGNSSYGLSPKLMEDVIDEMADFPNGKHDDIVDSSSGAYNKLSLKKEKKKIRVLL